MSASAQPTPESEAVDPLIPQTQALLEAGNLAQARANLLQILSNQEAKDGPFHQDPVSTRLLLARVTALLGEPEAAEEVLLPLQQTPEDSPLHASTFLHARSLISSIRRLQGRYEEAFQLAAASLAFFDQAQDPVNPDSFRTIVHLVELARDAEQLQQALDLCTQGIERFQGKVGEAHAHFILLAASILQADEQYGEARTHLEALLPQIREQLGENHDLVARVCHQLGLLSHEEDDNQQAIAHFEACLKAMGEAGDPELQIETRYQLALLQAPHLEPEKAIALLDSVRSMAGRLFGPRSPKVAEISSSMGYQARTQGQTSIARTHYSEALSIWKSWRTPADPRITLLESTLQEIGE